MPAELYTSGKPGIPRRALLASVLLLVTTCILAAEMTRTRNALARRIEPEGWSISFQPPRHFAGEFGLTKFGQTFQFYRPGAPGVGALLAVHHLQVQDVRDARAACNLVLQAHLGTRIPGVAVARFTWSNKRMGSFEATEIWDPLVDVAVRAVVLAPGDAYIVSLSLSGAAIDSSIYGLFEQTCSSIEYLGP